MGLFDLFKKKVATTPSKTYICARCKKEITDEESKWIGNHRFCVDCAAPPQKATIVSHLETEAKEAEYQAHMDFARGSLTPEQAYSNRGFVKDKDGNWVYGKLMTKDAKMRYICNSPTESDRELCNMINQSFWMRNEMYEPLPTITIVKKGYRSVVNSHGQSELWALVRDLQNSNFLFRGSIGNYGYSFDIFPLNKTNALPNIDTIGKIKDFLKDYRASKQKEIPLLLSKKDYNKLSNALTYGTLGEGKCICCGKKAQIWWCDIGGKYCYDCVKEKIVITNPIVDVKN